MKKSIIFGRIKLEADEGKVITDGTNYYNMILLLEGESDEGYSEIDAADVPKEDN